MPEEKANGGAKVLPFLSREQILAADDVRYETVEMPEWGGPIRLRTLTGDQAQRFQDLNEEQKSEQIALILSLAIVDADGDRVFEEHDLKALSRKSMRPLMRALKTVNKMNGFEKDAAEELAKGSGAATPAASPSA